MNTEIEDRTDAPGASPAPGGSHLDVGPVIALPFVRLGLAATVAAACVGAIGWMVVLLLGKASVAGTVLGVWAGALSVAVAHWAGLASMEPWKGRHLGRWPFVWLRGRGVSFVGVLACALLLYFAARPEPLSFGLAVAGGYFAALLAEVGVYAHHVRSATAGSQA